ncbi:MAG: diacylglycerol kinase family lipid kinase [Melioribacteraceae bacterium]|nr:diacylglycerol kinase family lipid kinase [Melioribacteraceae bacterium]
MKDILFIVNPVSGKGKTAKMLPILKEKINEHKKEIEIIVTEYPLHAVEIARANSHDFVSIVAVGGDGTLNEVLNGIDLISNVNFGVLPSGSGNDFAHNFKLSDNFLTNFDLILDSNHKITKIDIGSVGYTTSSDSRVHSKKFINSLGIGFDALVAHYNQNNKTLKGLASYITAIIKALKNSRPIKLTVDNNIIKKEYNVLFASVGNGKTAGGGLYLTPDAELNDGLLDITYVDAISKPKLLRSLPLAIINKIKKLDVVEFDTFLSTEIELEFPYFVHVDGEVIAANVKSIKIDCLKHALKIISN